MTSKDSCGKAPLRLIIVGAGVSGILMGYKLKQAFGDRVVFHIFEKNADVGGTWLENRYPGCACDVPSHIYQYSFCPNPYWSSFYASSTEIQAYLRAVVFNFKLESYISFKSKIESAKWDETRSIWTVSVEGKGSYECDVLVNAAGILNNLSYPNLENLGSFSGQLMHTAAWDRDIDIKGKKVAIIGAGASAIQLLPTIQPHVSHIDIFIRTPSWITPPAGGMPHGKLNHDYTPEEQSRFRDDPVYSLQVRKSMENGFNSMYKAFFKDSPDQKEWRDKMATRMQKLINSKELQNKLIPSFELGCRRINPGERYLDAIQKDNVRAVFGQIDEVTANGIVSEGTEHQVDIIIAATGFDTSFRPRFPIIGQDGVDLRELWKDDPTSYLGVAVSGYSNYLTFLGPNTPISNGSLMGSLEGTGDYFIRLLRKMMDENVASFNVRKEAQADFDSYTQKFMKGMVWSGTCRSWYKRSTDGKVTALWPGSSLHYLEVLESNRWEDFEWKYRSNRFSFWEKGFSKREVEDGEAVDFSHYLQSHPNLPLEAYYSASRGYRDTFESVQHSAFAVATTN